MNSPESSHVLHAPQIAEQPVTPEHEPELHLREGVLRPDDIVKKGIRDRAKALAMAGVVGLSGAMMADDAKAGVFEDSLARTATILATNALNDVLPGQIRTIITQNGEVTVMPNPRYRPGTKINLEVGIREYATSLGLMVSEPNQPFAIWSNVNPSGGVSIVNSQDPSQYTTNISITKAQGGGLMITTRYMLGGQARTQLAVMRVDQTGKSDTTILSN